MIADDRRFEELLYSIFRAKIEVGTLPAYDDVSLMSGVRDAGRDCVLYRNGQCVGLIQCKQSEKSLSKELFGKEITKFVLYSLANPELIPDPDDFKYIIAVSKGFTNDCVAFIDGFPALIGAEPKLHAWIKAHLEQPTLALLKGRITDSDVLAILQRMKISKIQPPDLDRYLMETDVKHIIPLFFQVRTITADSGAVDPKWSSFGQLPEDELQKQLIRASAVLSTRPNELDDIRDSHIRRSETTALLDWVMAPAVKDDKGRDKNICLLAGNAGVGKTVILKDLYDDLGEAGIPVLGMKADRIYPINMQDLQQKIELTLPVPEFIDQCRQHFEKTVILIDQIDALSQSMSADRNYLYVFRQLIDQLTYDPNIRIIISVRIFDLNYDPELRVYRQIKSIEVGLLPEADVWRQLTKIGVAKDMISPKLLTLLRTPSHLNTFATIYARRDRALSEITSLQELYLELWTQKILKAESYELKELLYTIARRMFSEQRISLSVHEFENEYQALAYLQSERVLRIEDKQLQFFHQSFYDFVFFRNNSWKVGH